MRKMRKRRDVGELECGGKGQERGEKGGGKGEAEKGRIRRKLGEVGFILGKVGRRVRWRRGIGRRR
jgi:hypothetical protein